MPSLLVCGEMEFSLRNSCPEEHLEGIHASCCPYELWRAGALRLPTEGSSGGSCGAQGSLTLIPCWKPNIGSTIEKESW